ncbi:putative DNA-binding domain-containing protein [Synechococcus sp. L2F]|nr:putative DNA-binding domain-containing protein [Synechococcus sp. L2F]
MEIYPICERLVGEPFFAAMAARCASEHASPSPDLGDFGGELPAFLRAFTPNGTGCSTPPMRPASTSRPSPACLQSSGSTWCSSCLKPVRCWPRPIR